MGCTTNELKYAECDFCGRKQNCFVQVALGEELAVCPDCFCIADLD